MIDRDIGPFVAKNGESGDPRLRGTSVLIVGVGRVGSVIALVLSASGVGRLGLADHGVVDHQDLRHQPAHRPDAIGRSKVESASATLKDSRTATQVETYHTTVGPSNASAIVGGYDVTIDVSDDESLHHSLAAACANAKCAYLFGSAGVRFGRLGVFCGPRGCDPHAPCYHCIFPTPKDQRTNSRRVSASARDDVVRDHVSSVIGMVAAAETLRVVLGEGAADAGRLLTFDAESGRYYRDRVSRDPRCTRC